MSEMIVKFHCDEHGIARSWDEVCELVRCKDCKHFETDKAYEVDGWPLPIFGHEVCTAWGDGCKTDPDGWCFMGELRGERNG